MTGNTEAYAVAALAFVISQLPTLIPVLDVKYLGAKRGFRSPSMACLSLAFSAGLLCFISLTLLFSSSLSIFRLTDFDPQFIQLATTGSFMLGVALISLMNFIIRKPSSISHLDSSLSPAAPCLYPMNGAMTGLQAGFGMMSFFYERGVLFSQMQTNHGFNYVLILAPAIFMIGFARAYPIYYSTGSVIRPALMTLLPNMFFFKGVALGLSIDPSYKVLGVFHGICAGILAATTLTGHLFTAFKLARSNQSFTIVIIFGYVFGALFIYGAESYLVHLLMP